MDLRPAWQTDELAEEWVDPPSPTSPTSTSLPSPPKTLAAQATPPPVPPTYGSIKWVGTTSRKPRALSASSAYNNGRSARRMRVVSGDVENSLGSLLAQSPEGLDSPPTSEGSHRSSSSQSLSKSPTKRRPSSSLRTESPPIGTFVVKSSDTPSDKEAQQAIGLGKALRNPFLGPTSTALGGGGLFAKSRLESMFDPPPSDGGGASSSNINEGAAAITTEEQQPIRRTSHSYVPSKPSRLSESLTPPSRTSSASSSAEMGVEINHVEERSSSKTDSGVDDGTPTPNPNKIRHFSGSKLDERGQREASPFDDVEFSFSPQRLGMSVLGMSTNRAPLGGQTPALKLFQRTYDTYTREHLSAIVDSISAQGTPVRVGGGKMRRRSGSSFASGSGSSRSRSGRGSSEGTISSDRSRRSWIERDSASPSAQHSSSNEDEVDSDSYRAPQRIRLSASPRSDVAARSAEEVEERRQGSGKDRRSWGEKGEEVLRRIRERKWGSPESSWTGSRRDESTAPSSSPSMQSIPPTPPLQSATSLAAPTHTEPALGAYGSYRSTLSGTGSGSSGTITEQYISAGRNIMDKIKLRNVSDSSATTGSDGQKGKAVGKTSPRKLLRTLSEVDEMSRVEYAEAGPSRLRPGSAMSGSVADSSTTVKAAVRQPASTGVGPQVRIAAPFGQQRPPTIAPEDLNRYVSSASTANTNATAISTSFVKHRGPAPPPSQGRKFKDVITFESVQKQLPDVVGRMVFDKQQMKWVKAPSNGGDVMLEENQSSTASDRSVDVFAGLESLKEDVEPTPSPPRAALESSSQSPQSFTSARSDAGTGHSGEAARTDAATVDNFSQLSMRDDQYPASEPPAVIHVIKPSFDRSFQFPHAQRPDLLATHSDPTPEAAQVNATPNPARTRDNAPASALKKRIQAIDPTTPVNNSGGKGSVTDSADRRSVSFSDGRKSGKMLDVRVLAEQSKKRRAWNDLARPVSAAASSGVFESETTVEAGGVGVSMRTTRIREMVDALDETVDESVPTPSKRTASSSSRSLTRSESDQSAETNDEAEDSELTRGGLSRYTYAKLHPGNATFLTECSFAVAHEKLVELITEVQPFEPHWELLTKIDLSGRGADSVARLKEFLPTLDEAILNDNVISYLSGIPSTVRSLQVAGNRLTSLTAVNHLQHLQYLDISRNQIESVNALTCLRHLRELRMDDNKISDISDIMDMDCLIKLSCSRNAIEQVDLTKAKWAKMEVLDLSSNRIKRLESVDGLRSLNTLNLEYNRLESLSVMKPMQQLRSLRVSHNSLCRLDVSALPRLRTLYADNNAISYLERSGGPPGSRLENISLRNQRVDRLSLKYEDLREAKRLYISGNPLPPDFFPHRPLFSLVYLEAAACKLSEWPTELARHMPNLRCLNLNYNFLRDLDGLQGMTALRKLMMVSGRLGANGTKHVLRGLRGLEGLQEVDLRMNPCNLNYYLPLLLPGGTASSALDPSAAGTNQKMTSSLSWLQLDDNFRRSLPDEWYSKRLIYRGMIMMACDGIVQVDGIAVSEAERAKARQLIEGGTRER